MIYISFFYYATLVRRIWIDAFFFVTAELNAELFSAICKVT